MRNQKNTVGRLVMMTSLALLQLRVMMTITVYCCNTIFLSSLSAFCPVFYCIHNKMGPSIYHQHGQIVSFTALDDTHISGSSWRIYWGSWLKGSVWLERRSGWGQCPWWSVWIIFVCFLKCNNYSSNWIFFFQKTNCNMHF